MRRDLVVRAVVPLAALLTLLVGVAAPVPGALALVGAGLAAERLARLREDGVIDRLLLVVGGVLVALVLTGMLLGLVRVDLRAASWTVALGLLGLAGLALAAVRPRVPGRPFEHRTTALRLVPWLVAAVVVCGVAVTVSVRSLDTVSEQPLQMSFGTITGTRVPVVVSAGRRTGPLEVRASSTSGDDLSYPLFTVAAGRTVTTTLVLPTDGRFVITLHYPDQTRPLRTLVLDR